MRVNDRTFYLSSVVWVACKCKCEHHGNPNVNLVLRRIQYENFQKGTVRVSLVDRMV